MIWRNNDVWYKLLLITQLNFSHKPPSHGDVLSPMDVYSKWPNYASSRNATHDSQNAFHGLLTKHK